MKLYISDGQSVYYTKKGIPIFHTNEMKILLLHLCISPMLGNDWIWRLTLKWICGVH